MKRVILQSYRMYPLQGFESTGFELVYEVSYLWGLLRRVVKSPYFIPNHKSIKTFTDHWDKLIQDKSLIK